MSDTETRIREYWSWITAENPAPEAEDVIQAATVASIPIGEGPVRPLEIRPVPGERRRWLVASASALAVVVVVMVPLLLSTGSDEVDPGNTRFDGVTTAFTPTGELVASMYQHVRVGGSFGDSWLYLYADGRLIWMRSDQARWDCAPTCDSPVTDLTNGWFEQRLTPEGVSLIRSVIVATGLFDTEDQGPRADFGYIQVRNQDRLVFQGRVPELSEQLAQLWKWLPASVWDEAEPKTFVASGHAVCVHVGGYVEPVDPEGHLAELPAEARTLLANAALLRMADLIAIDPAGFGGAPLFSDPSGADGPPGYCFDVSTDDARSLTEILDDAGVQRVSETGYLVSGAAVDSSGAVGPDAVTLGIWPMLPHGVPAFTGG